MSRTVRYTLDPRTSRFTLRVTASGALSAFGHNPTFAVRDFQGEVVFDPSAPASSSLRLVVQAASLELVDEASEKDRREIERAARQEVLETATYPTITYECPASKVTMHGPLQLTLGGDLTLHGETRPQTVLARVYVNGDTLRGQGEATVRQSAYGIRLYSGLGGMLKVKDDVHLVFDILARAAPTPPESAQRGEPGTAPGDREEPRTTVQAR